ncbi:hypothetical protein KIL84_021206 [Mauremys mutica]|uniref:Uncharacterized protein n=1 Tax=Mauremys mutica TaxID=74926 RepID=A0A9D4AU73_9SAUR|nr:hypothetical protein KIL84_021206 [Mauremys mutica]
MDSKGPRCSILSQKPSLQWMCSENANAGRFLSQKLKAEPGPDLRYAGATPECSQWNYRFTLVYSRPEPEPARNFCSVDTGSVVLWSVDAASPACFEHSACSLHQPQSF